MVKLTHRQADWRAGSWVEILLCRHRRRTFHFLRDILSSVFSMRQWLFHRALGVRGNPDKHILLTKTNKPQKAHTLSCTAEEPAALLCHLHSFNANLHPLTGILNVLCHTGNGRSFPSANWGPYLMWLHSHLWKLINFPQLVYSTVLNRMHLTAKALTTSRFDEPANILFLLHCLDVIQTFWTVLWKEIFTFY